MVPRDVTRKSKIPLAKLHNAFIATCNKHVSERLYWTNVYNICEWFGQNLEINAIFVQAGFTAAKIKTNIKENYWKQK